jgi:hypothetical protein
MSLTVRIMWSSIVLPLESRVLQARQRLPL